ncbi:MAG: sensor domain-containing diguanylate cyclase [Bdellovibrionota bacterium]
MYYKDKKNIKTVLLCPVVEDDRLHGVFLIDHQEHKNYHNHEISVIERIVKHFYHIIKDSKTIAQFEHLKQEFSSFYQAGSALNRAFHLHEVLETLLRMARTIAPYDWGTIVLYNKDLNKNMIVLDSDHDPHNLVGKTFPLAYQKGLVSWVIDQMKPLHYNQFTKKYRHSPLFHADIKAPNLYESVLVLPLYVQEEKIGAMVLMSEENFFFTRIIQNMLEVTVFQAAIAIKNAISVGHLEKLATTDGLTGLINHRTFQDELGQELQRAKRYNQELSMILLDLDFFKKINDEYGHPAGDLILKKTAAFLQEQVRTTDLVARYGGEEFAIILPNTNAKDAQRLANRMIEKVHQQKWQYENITIPVTFSMGLASFPEHAEEKSTLIEYADQALYHAKNSGRDRVSVFAVAIMSKDAVLRENQLIEKIEKQVQS